MMLFSKWPQDPPCSPPSLCIWDYDLIFLPSHAWRQNVSDLWPKPEGSPETFQSPTRLISLLEI